MAGKLEVLQDEPGGANHEVIRNMQRAFQIDDRPAGLPEIHFQCVFEADGLEYSAEFVIAVGAFIEDAQVEIQLRKGGYRNCHG